MIDEEYDPEVAPQLAIKLSCTTALRSCVVCGELTEARCGPKLFMADTDDLVCGTVGSSSRPS